MNTKKIKDKQIMFKTPGSQFTFRSINENDLSFYVDWYINLFVPDYNESEHKDLVFETIRGTANIGYKFIIEDNEPIAEIYIGHDKIFKIENMKSPFWTFDFFSHTGMDELKKKFIVKSFINYCKDNISKKGTLYTFITDLTRPMLDIYKEINFRSIMPDEIKVNEMFKNIYIQKDINIYAQEIDKFYF
ncbi:MAG: hypothetical protein JW969_14810 [Spirochaetales bacterium]|nr:hypothetical protein [Spirochaetales bacterium]